MPSGADSSPSDPAVPADHEAVRRAERRAQNDAWGATSLLISGVVVWGGAGYLVAEWLHHQVFTMVGLLLGTTTALYGIWFRYGRS